MKADKKLWIAGSLLAGAAAGVVAGILLAPDKGSATRRKIAEKGEAYLDDLHDQLDEVLAQVTQKISQVKQELRACAQHENCSCDTRNTSHPGDQAATL